MAGGSRRNAHRADIGIALYLDYTGMGIGKKLFALILEIIVSCGFESAELTVVEGNNRAIKTKAHEHFVHGLIFL